MIYGDQCNTEFYEWDAITAANCESEGDVFITVGLFVS